MRCLQHFSSEIILEKHKSDCLVVNGEQRVKLVDMLSLKIMLINCMFLLKFMLILSVF